MNFAIRHFENIMYKNTYFSYKISSTFFDKNSATPEKID